MILIADAGSTKTHWSLCSANGQHSDFQTEGINPFFQTVEEIQRIVSLQLLPHTARYLWAGKITHLYFYGAGCAFPDKEEMIVRALQVSYPTTEIRVASDLLGAARGLLGASAGIACIMGTGSNSCLYDGERIVQNVSPLGYVLGDEGSGAVLGRRMVGDVLKKQLPESVCTAFFERYQLTPAEVLDRVYKQPFPNRFLASFAPFVCEHLDDPSVIAMVRDEFDAFVRRNVMQYNVADVTVNFVGSVAYHFREVLAQVVEAHGLLLGTIVQSPREGLRAYHKRK